MALTCPRCSYAYNDDGATICQICKAPLPGMPAASTTRRPVRADREPDVANFQDSSGEADMRERGPRLTSPAHDPELPPTIASTPGQLRGRIVHLERYEERPPADMYRLVARLLIIVLVLIPYLVLFAVSGILSFGFVLIGFATLAQLFNPLVWTATILELWEVLILRRIRGADTFPVYRGMIEDLKGQEHSFIFRGPLQLGNLVVGHNVSLQGTWCNGTLLAHAGEDRTTGTVITSNYRNPWRIILLIVLGIYLLLGATLLIHWRDLRAWWPFSG